VQSEISQCQSVRQEYLPALELGTVDPDAVLPEFLDKLDKAGAQKIVDEMQKQINAWKK
jgi:putative aldouronate transport system substrate-binding protein